MAIVEELINASKTVHSNFNATNVDVTNVVYLKKIFLPSLYDRILELIYAPFNNIEALYAVTPLILALVIMEFYFGRYKKEQLGWNTAVANSLILIFVAFNLFVYVRNLYGVNGIYELFSVNLKPWIALLILLEGAFLLFINFFHLLPEKLTFRLSSPLQVHLTAYVGVVFVYSNIAIDYTSLVAVVLLFIGLWVIFKIIRSIEWSADKKEENKNIEK